jgi:hypothetical protein
MSMASARLLAWGGRQQGERERRDNHDDVVGRLRVQADLEPGLGDARSVANSPRRSW